MSICLALVDTRINAGTAAGQTIMHSHIHLIPRRKDDVVSPRAGVRGVVPGMQSY